MYLSPEILDLLHQVLRSAEQGRHVGRLGRGRGHAGLVEVSLCTLHPALLAY